MFSRHIKSTQKTQKTLKLNSIFEKFHAVEKSFTQSSQLIQRIISKNLCKKSTAKGELLCHHRHRQKQVKVLMNGMDLKGRIMEKGTVVEKEGEIGLKARTVLWYLTFFGFAINYIVRINAAIAIVDMIDVNYRKSTGNKTIVTSECIVERNFTIAQEPINRTNLIENTKYVSLERRLLNFLEVSHKSQATRHMMTVSYHTKMSHRLTTMKTVLNGMKSNSRSFWDRFSGSIGRHSCPAGF